MEGYIFDSDNHYCVPIQAVTNVGCNKSSNNSCLSCDSTLHIVAIDKNSAGHCCPHNTNWKSGCVKEDISTLVNCNYFANGNNCR